MTITKAKDETTTQPNCNPPGGGSWVWTNAGWVEQVTEQITEQVTEKATAETPATP